MTDEQRDQQPEIDEPAEHVDDETAQPRTSRDVLYEQIGIALVNAGVVAPAAQFIADVRDSAGFRVSPREVVVAVEQMAGANEPISVESVAEMVATLRGDRSSRQQRHADSWRTLGAQLAIQGQDGTPEGQRAFIGTAHAIAGRRATDALLLQIALALAEQGQRLDSSTVGKIGRRLAASAADIAPEHLGSLVERELRSVIRSQRAERSGKKPKQPVRTGPWSQAHNPGARKWRPGGRRRRKVKLPPAPKPDPFEQ